MTAEIAMLRKRDGRHSEIRNASNVILDRAIAVSVQ
jgi:hypothetical protein